MPVEQLDSRCWALHPSGGASGDDLRHWDTQSLALARLDELPPAARSGVTLQRLPSPCWTVTCDVCGALHVDVDDANHSPDPAAAEQWAAESEWVVTLQRRVYCPACIPECDMADLEILAGLAGTEIRRAS